MMVGDFYRVNRDGICISKGSIVEVRAIDADNKLDEKGLVGSAYCHPLDEEQFEFDGGIWCDFLDPIPLTPEILEKNGFRRAKEQETALSTVYMSPYPVRVCEAAKVKVVFYDLPICGVNVLVQIEADTRSGGGVNSLHSCDIEYVHQLQHALRICGIEKEIEL